MRYAIWFAALVGLLMIGPLIVAVIYDKPGQEFEALMAIAGVALMAPAVVWGLWRGFWAVFRQTVKEARQATR